MSEDDKKKNLGESDGSITKIEKRKSDAPASSAEASSSEPAKADADEKDEEKSEEPPAKPAQKAAKKGVDDDSPTGAQTPIAKKPEPKAVVEPPAVFSKSKKAEEEEEDEDDEDEDEDDEDEDDAPVKRPAPRVAGPGDARRGRAAGQSAGFMLAVGAGIVLANLALQGTVLRYDATDGERFTLSKKGTGHLLSTLTKPLNIRVYAPEGLATVDAFVRDLRDMLNEYARYGGGKVTYEIIYPDRLEGEQKQKAEADAQEAGLKKQIMGEAKGGAGGTTGSIGQGYLGLVMTYGGEKATLDQQDGFDERNPTGLEFLISGKIRELRDKEDKIVHKIGYLQGHKEKGYQELSQVFGKYFPYYKFEAVDLAKGEKDVDETLDGLIMSTPDEEISTKELRRIDKFLMKGKALAVFANNLHLKDTDPTMNATFSGMGVDKLLSGYGIDFKAELLVDRQQFWTPVLMGPQGMGIQLPPYPLVLMADGGRPKTTFDNSFAPFFRLPQVAVPFPTEITIDGNRAGGSAVKVTPVLKTSGQILTVQGASISMHPGKAGEGATGQKPEKREAIVGVNLEGPIKSSFPGGGEGVDGVPVQATGNARLFVLSSSAFFSNPFQDAGKSAMAGMMPGMDPNMGADEELMRYAQIYQRARMASLLVAKQTCDWISQETDLLAVGAKLMAEPELTYPHTPQPEPSMDEKPDSESAKKKKTEWIERVKSDQNMTKYFNIFAGPALLGLYGLFRWWNRNSKRAAVKI
ncbi:MAG: GldG family protein [Myxococcales bacterium]|nr:GldG family protein [Myxococcales bacterium]